MEKIFKEHLFNHHILVNDTDQSVTTIEVFATVVALAKKFGIRVTKGASLVTDGMIRDAADFLGEYVPDPFYRDFPMSVKALTKDQLLYDQLMHYSMTYGMGWFEDAGHSVFEDERFERLTFNESVQPKEFIAVNETEAEKILFQDLSDLLSSTRPLNPVQHFLITEAWKTYGGVFLTADIPCKRTVVELLYETKEIRLAKNLQLHDVIKLVEYIHWHTYGKEDLKKLNLKNQDRKLITNVMNWIFDHKEIDWTEVSQCFEKRKIWTGLLHHIHYIPRNDNAKYFVETIRENPNNISPYAYFEYGMKQNPAIAARSLMNSKGSGAVLRNLNYILSRCKTYEEAAKVFDVIDGKANPVILIQLLQQYHTYQDGSKRIFCFAKNNTLRIHRETDDEQKARRSYVSEGIRTVAYSTIREMLRKSLKDRLGKVWIDPDMRRIAVPLKMTVGFAGFDVLPSGSRVPIPEGKKVRAFTYWEKVNDIDLSCFGLTEDGKQQEFSWRNMWWNQGEDMLFSGDETSGYNGGSEYFDIDIDKFRENHPDFRYIVFCDNVFSMGGSIHFKDCVCKAGFMVREKIDSGEIFEPKTVQTSFRITGDSSFGYLFAIDLENREMIWLNLERSGNHAIAGKNRMDILLSTLKAAEAYNVMALYSDAAAEIVENPQDADVIVTANGLSPAMAFSKKEPDIVNPWNIEKMIGLMTPIFV